MFLLRITIQIRDVMSCFHLINRSSACSDNHNERGNALELQAHKAAGTPTQPRMKINKVKTFKYMSHVVFSPNYHSPPNRGRSPQLNKEKDRPRGGWEW